MVTKHKWMGWTVAGGWIAAALMAGAVRLAAAEAVGLGAAAFPATPTVVSIPEAPTYLIGAGAFGLLLCVVWQAHSQGRGVTRINHQQPRGTR